jgi:hypothetical protein
MVSVFLSVDYWSRYQQSAKLQDLTTDESGMAWVQALGSCAGRNVGHLSNHPGLGTTAMFDRPISRGKKFEKALVSSRYANRGC